MYIGITYPLQLITEFCGISPKYTILDLLCVVNLVIKNTDNFPFDPFDTFSLPVKFAEKSRLPEVADGRRIIQTGIPGRTQHFHRCRQLPPVR